jgi:hypothetical protein
MQEDVWVDYLGNELELSSMSAPHVRNLLAFTRGQAARIREMVDPDLALDQLPALVAGLASDPDLVRDAEAGYNRGAIASLERTPLVRALQALAAITDTTDDDGTAS